MNRKKLKVLIGLSWPYANGRLHIGHVASSLPADALARFHRSIGNDVSFVTGSDCFGTPILVQAQAEGVAPAELVDKYHKLFEQDFKALGFTIDAVGHGGGFGKTMSPQHQKFVQQFHAEMYKGDYICEKTLPQLYCEKCARFLPDRYVEGTCPHCKKDAKGDACDACGKMLEPEELIKPRCKTCKATPVIKDATQLYLRLTAMQEMLQQYVDKQKHLWPANAAGMAQRYLDEGLHDRAITRSMEWGIGVPEARSEKLRVNSEEWKDRRIYVWAEAVLGYLSASTPEFIVENMGTQGGRGGERPTKLHYYVHAKDNIPFHTIVFQGLLLANGNGVPKYHMPDIMVSSEHLMINGDKMSKSKGNVLTASELLSEFDVDMIRYYFLRTTNSAKDSNFTFNDFINVVNGELVNNFGNLVNRTLSFVKSKFDGKIPHAKVDICTKEYHDSMLAGKTSFALGFAMGIVNYGNKFFAEKKPWLSNDKQCIAEVISILKTCTELLEPFIPTTCAKVKNWLSGDTLPEIDILFKRLDMKEVKEKFPKYV